MATNWLLLEDVIGAGRKGEIVTRIKPGYARNYLEPKGFIIRADKHTVKLQEKLQEERKVRAEQDKQQALKFAETLKDVTLEITVKCDKSGHLYGSVSTQDIANLLHDKTSITLNKRNVQLRRPIKQAGTYQVDLSLDEGVLAQVTLNVLSETPIEVFVEETVEEVIVEETTVEEITE